MRYPIAIEPRTDRSDYGVVVPDLPGCFSSGDTLEEAIAGAEEAGLAWIDAALDAGEAVPPPSALEAIRANPEYAGWILSVVTIDPAALDDAAERVNIHCRAGFFVAWTKTHGRLAKRDPVTSSSSRSGAELRFLQNCTASPPCGRERLALAHQLRLRPGAVSPSRAVG